MTPVAETPSTLAETARIFFEACEAGRGWDSCGPCCDPNATFSAQAEPLLELTTLQQYTDWMKATSSLMPAARYDLKAFATDVARDTVVAFATFHATHTGEGGPVPPTGRSTSTDYVYVMQFQGDKIAHMTKVWNAGYAMRELGWA